MSRLTKRKRKTTVLTQTISSCVINMSYDVYNEIPDRTLKDTESSACCPSWSVTLRLNVYVPDTALANNNIALVSEPFKKSPAPGDSSPLVHRYVSGPPSSVDLEPSIFI